MTTIKFDKEKIMLYYPDINNEQMYKIELSEIEEKIEKKIENTIQIDDKLFPLEERKKLFSKAQKFEEKHEHIKKAIKLGEWRTALYHSVDGFGLKCFQKIPKNLAYFVYSSTVVKNEDTKNSRYLVGINKKYSFDCQSTIGLGGFIQHAYSLEFLKENFWLSDKLDLSSIATANTAVYIQRDSEYRPVPFVVNTEDIEKNHIITIDYGLSYWLKLGIAPHLYTKTGKNIDFSLFLGPLQISIPSKKEGHAIMLSLTGNHRKEMASKIKELKTPFYTYSHEDFTLTLPSEKWIEFLTNTEKSAIHVDEKMLEQIKQETGLKLRQQARYDKTNAKDFYQFMRAVYKNYSDVIEHKGNPSLKNLLHQAVEGGNPDKIKMILCFAHENKIDLNKPDKDGKTPYQYAQNSKILKENKMLLFLLEPSSVNHFKMN